LLIEVEGVCDNNDSTIKNGEMLRAVLERLADFAVNLGFAMALFAFSVEKVGPNVFVRV